jgi:hypothetical protein
MYKIGWLWQKVLTKFLDDVKIKELLRNKAAKNKRGMS